MDRTGYLLVVTSRPEPAIEDDWNRWYAEVHLPEIADCPGFGATRRYRHDAPSAEFNARRGWGPFAGKVAWTTRLYRRIADNEPAAARAKE